MNKKKKILSLSQNPSNLSPPGYPEVVGIGVSTLDHLFVVDEFPSGETVQQASQACRQGGGPVATALVALARLGIKTAMIDQLGNDTVGREIIAEFNREGVATNWINILDGQTSSLASVYVRRTDGARSIVFSKGSCGEQEPAAIPEMLIRQARIVHLNGRHYNACLTAARIARENKVLVSFDGGAHRFHPGLKDLLSLCDICIVAKEFANSLWPGTPPEAAAEAMLEYGGPTTVVVTDGARGSVTASTISKTFYTPAFTVKQVVDTTGAGDAFHGGFLYGILQNYPLEQTATFASAVAALNIQGLGGRTRLPSLEEVEPLMETADRKVKAKCSLLAQANRLKTVVSTQKSDQ